MARLKATSSDRRREAMYWAVIECHRKWISFDKPMLAYVHRNGGRLDDVSIAMIGKEYGIARNLTLEGKRKDPTLRKKRIGRVKMALNPFRKRGSIDLIKRARKCRKATEKLRRLNPRRALPASYVTKMVWFVSPRGWTVYDDQVAKAIVGASGNAVEKMETYYKSLVDRRYAHWCRVIGTELRKNSLGSMYPGRVIDKFLWYVGADDDKQRRATTFAPAYLASLDITQRTAVRTTAKALSRIAARNDFLRESKCNETQHS